MTLDATDPKMKDACILLLDDDVAALEELGEIVELEDWRFRTTTTVDAAMAEIAGDPTIRVVVTDVHILEPGGKVSNGVEFVAAARAAYPDRPLAFIVLSGDASAVSASLETGAADFLTKPLMPDDLVAAIEHALTTMGVPSQDADLAEVLMRKMTQKTEALQRVSTNLMEREAELAQQRDTEETSRRDIVEIRTAIASGAIVPWFQPQVDIRTGVLVGIEALVRWCPPGEAPRSPAAFLQRTEACGLLGELDAHVQRLAFEAAARLRSLGVLDCQVGINTTAAQLGDPDVVDNLSMEVERAGLIPEMVAIEVLESAMLDDRSADPIKNNVTRLSRLGFHIELDDFGTGHSGFSSLRDLAVNRIKIDRSFVQNIHQDLNLQKFTQALIGLGLALDIEVLAEGIECQEESDWLREAGCQTAQGYFFGKPMPIDALISWHQTRARTGSAA